MTVFSDWLNDQMETLKKAGSLRAVMDRTQMASPNTVRMWRNGKSNPEWENTAAIAQAFNVPREFVREMCGYVDTDADPYIAEASLTPDEAVVIRAVRQDASGRLMPLLLNLVDLASGEALTTA